MEKMSGFEHLIKATWYSVEGLKRAWREEQAFRHEGIVLAILLLLLLLTEKSVPLTLLALGGWLFVMSIELLNSAIENIFNMITQERDDRIKAGKDMASAAIFLAIVANVGIWLFVFF